MQPPDQIILDAMAFASERKKVVFLTDNMATTSAVVAQTNRVVVDKLLESGLTSHQVRDLVRIDFACPWKITVKNAGWVFFFPRGELKVDDDLDNPDLVFYETDYGKYVSVSYSEWKKAMTANPEATVWSSLW